MTKEIKGKPTGYSNVSLFCPPKLLEMVDSMVREPKYSSRSEFIRVAMRELVKREFMFEKYYQERKEEAEGLIIKSLIKSKKVVIDGKEYVVLREA